MLSATRRNTIKLVAVFGIAVAMFFTPTAARADGFLIGTWIVRCPNGHDDQVEAITRNHICEKCGAKAVDGGKAKVVCPKGHATQVEGITKQHKCTQPLPGGGECAEQCLRG